MNIGNYIGYYQYILFLFLLCGAVLLRLDAKVYNKEQHMKKEYTVATVLGWTHVGIGAIILLAVMLRLV
ncbi:CLC_0170 family protein [Paenibacillus ginsengihumi]|jgi:Trk-type K+ transport system membrane component|uniref:CLC_0170 family protein n=1 Tax=Paenibacillus ginsengihumi TaxID=431596 RepID=UPI00037FA0C0|nr:CLC_0170 family protein [Paenibacillus ginsengihumi]